MDERGGREGKEERGEGKVPALFPRAKNVPNAFLSREEPPMRSLLESKLAAFLSLLLLLLVKYSVLVASESYNIISKKNRNEKDERDEKEDGKVVTLLLSKA